MSSVPRVPSIAASMDRYQVQEYLAEGGMGAIYRGKQIGPLGQVREVVLKQLLPEFTQQHEFIELFVREAKLSASLDHPNIIRTTDLVTAGADYFIVMEYLYGADLRTLLRRAKRRGMRLAPAAALTIMRDVLAALAYAHAAQDASGQALHLIHRDVSPSNILVSARGEVKLTDFGIAKAATHNSGLFYRVKGKLGYMSPEQASSAPMDHRSDLFSVGVCLHEALTGERLYVHSGLTTSAAEMFAQPVPLVSRRVSGLPTELDGLLARALAITPSTRFQDASEFAAAIDRSARRHGLAMNNDQLTEHLRTICGPAASWREEVADPTPVRRAGTAVLDHDDNGELDHDLDSGEIIDDDDLLPMSVMTQQGIIPARRGRKQDSIPALDRLQHIELTSIVQLAATDPLGAEPLVDLDSADARWRSEASKFAARPFPADDSAVLVMPSAPRATGAPPTGRVAVTRAPTPTPVGRRLRTPIAVALLLLAGLAVALAIGFTGDEVELPPATQPSR